MPRKCSVFGCKSNFASKQKGKRGKKSAKNKPAKKYVKVFRFPTSLKERKIWVKCLPNDDLKASDITNNMVVCVKHWSGFETGTVPMRKVRGGHLVPSIPPDLFPVDSDLAAKHVKIPPSTIPKPPPKPRRTRNSSAAVSRGTLPDEMHMYVQSEDDHQRRRAVREN